VCELEREGEGRGLTPVDLLHFSLLFFPFRINRAIIRPARAHVHLLLQCASSL
jgi:hypothetical protein